MAAAGKFALPDPVAWKQIWNNPGHPMEHVQVILMDGDRWRVEERELSSSKIFVLIFDGTTFVSTNPKVTTKPVGSGPVMQASLSFLNGIKPLGTETRDGRSCLLFEMPPDAQSAKSRMWVDSQSHFPVVLDAWSPQGALTEMHFQLLKSDFSILSPKCFDIHNTAPMLTPLLTL